MWEKSAISGLKKAVVLSFVTGLALVCVPGASADTGLPDRSSDPVVLTGADTPRLIGLVPSEIVAFRYDDGWVQVPVQVDERKWADFRMIRRISVSSAQFGTEVYADAGTWTEADGVPQRNWNEPHQVIPGTTGDPLFDADDEIAMMAMDSGSLVGVVAPPAGVDDSTRTAVKISDPLAPTNNSYIYLFKTTTGLSPSAGKDYATYTQEFSPTLSSPYKTADTFTSGYNFNSIGDNVSGPPVNPESSSVVTDNYEQTFPGRWMVDGLKIKEGGASAADILDGDKSTITQNGCGRNELTFSRGGGGFIANIDGPVRVIRSYIGANSGTFTQRDQIYYSDQLNTNTYLRVHVGITDFIMAVDYSEAAFGMTYRNNLNEGGVMIDGVPDTVAPGQLTWEQATGTQGTLTNVGRIITDVATQPFTSYYQDSMVVPPDNDAIICSGDSHAIGASGPRIKFIGAGENTDPVLEPNPADVNHFIGHRTTFFDPPNQPVSEAKLRAEQVDSPLTYVTYAPKASARVIPVRVTKPVRTGRSVKIKVTVKNNGNLTNPAGKVCPKLTAKGAKSLGCKAVGELKPGASAVRYLAIKVRKNASQKSFKVRFQYRTAGKVFYGEGVRIRIARKK